MTGSTLPQPSTVEPKDLSEPSNYIDSERNCLTAADLLAGITEHLFFTLGKRAIGASHHDLYMALSYTVRDRLMSRHLAYKDALRNHQPKAVAYLSAEFLIGPQLGNNLLMLGIQQQAAEALLHFGVSDIEEILAEEEEPGLGNAGLGRLAACFLESLASLEIPATGYGIRYEFGIFDQLIKDGWPWKLVHPERAARWVSAAASRPTTSMMGTIGCAGFQARSSSESPMTSPCLVIGLTNTCDRLRLWRSEASESFDFHAFNSGDHIGAMEQKVSSETLSKILYPNDGTDAGRRLRLKQQIFFVSCSLQDMLRNIDNRGIGVQNFPDHWSIQLNDTHPAIAVAELMRLLVDECQLDWEKAWDITTHSIAYTNHTLMPETLEKWNLELFGSLLPRHLQLIYEINSRFLQQVRLH